MAEYPIDPVLPELGRLLSENQSVILCAPPGSGKTTRAPIALLDSFPPERGSILMLEPRRLAASSAARWMSKTLGEDVGETVGYAIRFDRKVSQKTRIEVVTEGILTRRLQSDQVLEGVGLVIFDEFHERSIHADMGLALCLDIQRTLRDDLRILVMSATLDATRISEMLGGAPVLVSEGRAYPVDERYIAQSTGSLAQRMADAVRQALRETEGDILAFLPGAGEIRQTANALDGLKGATVHTLFGDMPFDEQERAIMPSESRKVVLATNIAETSLTIEGVRVVIDSGLERRLEHDPSRGMNRLKTTGISRSSAAQRKGRAGRLGPGICYRLYSRHEHDAMLEHSQPEITTADLAGLVLDLSLWGVKDPSALRWLDPPPEASWAGARRLLEELGALDSSGAITETGRAMAGLPLHPRLARLALKAKSAGCPGLGADTAALLSEKDIIRRSVSEREPDISERLLMLGEWRKSGSLPSAADANALKSVDRTAKQILKLLGARHNRSGDESALPVLLLAAYPERVGKRREDGRYLLAQGRGVRLKGPSGLSVRGYIVAVELDSGERGEGVVHIASGINEQMIRRELGHIIETIRRVEWSSGRLVASSEERLGALVLSEKPFQLSDDEAMPHLCKAIRADAGLLSWSDGARQFQSRVGLVMRAFPEEGWPDMSDARLMETLEDWLGPHIPGVRTSERLAKIDLLPALEAMLDWKARKRLDELAPTHIQIPSGRRAELDYTAGAQPVLAVKLQEMFGAADTPRIAGGRAGVLIHLLSPAGRPLQITQDLAGFWRTGYHEVRKEMRGRYPKHPWPEDPATATPTARTKRRGA